MAEKVEFELVAPERLLYSASVDMVVVPGTEGDFGVLPGHAPLISLLRPGVIDVHDEGELSERIFVAGGFAEVTQERCTVLTAEAAPVRDLERGTVEARLKAARKGAGEAETDEERSAFANDIAVAEAMLALIEQA